MAGGLRELLFPGSPSGKRNIKDHNGHAFDPFAGLNAGYSVYGGFMNIRESKDRLLDRLSQTYSGQCSHGVPLGRGCEKCCEDQQVTLDDLKAKATHTIRQAIDNEPLVITDLVWSEFVEAQQAVHAQLEKLQRDKAILASALYDISMGQLIDNHYKVIAKRALALTE